MAFMRRDVNLGLLVLIIVSIILFSGFSVYYQTTFKDVSLEYQEKLEELSQVTKELGAQKEKLNETYTLRIRAETDRKSLDARYKDLSDENERLENDKANLQSELATTKSNLAEKRAELEATESLLAQTQSTLSAANSEISSLEARVNRLQNDIDEICDFIAAQGLTHDEC